MRGIRGECRASPFPEFELSGFAYQVLGLLYASAHRPAGDLVLHGGQRELAECAELFEHSLFIGGYDGPVFTDTAALQPSQLK